MSIKDFADKFIEKLDKKTAGIFLLSTGILIILQYNNIKLDFILCIFVFSLSILATCLITKIYAYIVSKVQCYKTNRKSIRYLISLPQKENEYFVSLFYDKENNEFKSTAVCEIGNSILATLQSMLIVYRPSEYAEYMHFFGFSLTPYILYFLNNGIKTGKISVGKNFVVNKRKLWR